MVIDLNINISKYNPLVGNSCIKLPKQLDHPQKALINIKNTDGNKCNKCFKWCLVRYLHSVHCNKSRIRKVDKDFARELDFEDENFPAAGFEPTTT